jgi:hypothetical protein
MKFDWQADEDKGWEGEATPAEQPAAPPRSRRGWWLTLLLVLLVVLGSGGLLYRQLQGQANERAETIRQDVFASYNVIWQTAQRQDNELFVSLLSGRDPAWTESQKELLGQGLLFDRRPLGLLLVPAGRDVRSVELSPDLAEATLQADQVYEVAGHLPLTVTLRQTHVFRMGNRRWLLAPPNEDFWGPPVTQEQAYILATYPQRDREVGGRLALDLDEMVAALCGEVAGLECPAELTVPLHFDSNPASLVALDDPAAVYRRRDIRLPAPSLVGVPIDEAGYQALYQGYATWVARWVIARAAGWECCERIVFFEALVERQLAESGRRPWPLTAADYERLLDQPPHYSELAALWQRDDSDNLTAAERRQVQSLIDYLLYASPQTTAATLQQRLVSQSAFGSWLLGFIDAQGVEVVREQAWAMFAYQRSLSGNRSRPLPLPDDPFTFLCSGLSGPAGASLDRYHLATNSWTELWSDAGLYLISDLPNGMGIALLDFSPRGRTLLWRDGAVQLVYDQGSDEQGWFFMSGDPSGRYLAMSASDGEGVSRYAVLDLSRCDTAGCLLTEIAGRPLWSPDGSQMILFNWGEMNTRQLVRADGSGRVLKELGEGVTPFWLDNTTYGYVRPSTGTNGPQASYTDVVIASVADDEASLLLTTESLAGLIGEASAAGPLSVMDVTINPADPNQIILLSWQGASTGEGRSYTFAVDRPSGEPSLLFAAERMVIWPTHFLNAGRWLLVRSILLGGESDGALHLYDFDERALTEFDAPLEGSYGVTADGQWIWHTGEGLLYLYAPAYDYRQVIEHGRPECRVAVME